MRKKNQKTTNDNHIHNEDKSNKSHKIIYNIKNATKNKTEDDIVQMIKKEIDFSENELHVWNRMISAISRMTFSQCFYSCDYSNLYLFLVFQKFEN